MDCTSYCNIQVFHTTFWDLGTRPHTLISLTAFLAFWNSTFSSASLWLSDGSESSEHTWQKKITRPTRRSRVHSNDPTLCIQPAHWPHNVPPLVKVITQLLAQNTAHSLEAQSYTFISLPFPPSCWHRTHQPTRGSSGPEELSQCPGLRVYCLACMEYGRRILDMNSLYYSQKMYTIRRVVAMVMVPSLQEYNYATNEVSNWWHNYECVTGPSGSSWPWR